MNKHPIVFTDFHHASLLNSLILFFEKRLGGSVFRPIGTEWYTQGFWKIYDHPATVEQYLGIGGATPDGSKPLNEIVYPSFPRGVYWCRDIESHAENKAITFDAFKWIQFDIVIASLPQHIEPFKNLISQYQPSAKLIYQIGNAWNIPKDAVKNVMASARIPEIPEGLNYIEYHQEFDLEIFSPSPAQPTNQITSFVNCFTIDQLFAEDWQLFEKIEKLMPEWVFKAYGGQCRDGSMDGSKAVADALKSSKFTWHTKRGGDGYGHIIHNTFAVGRPPIVKMEYYKGKLAEDLMIDGATCVAIDGLNPEQIVNKILFYSQQSEYQKLSDAAVLQFKAMVNFDDEEYALRGFLDNLK